MQRVWPLQLKDLPAVVHNSNEAIARQPSHLQRAHEEFFRDILRL